MAKPVVIPRYVLIPHHIAPCGHTLPFSSEQEGVFGAVASGSRFVDVNSKAGTGKTSTVAVLTCHGTRSGRRLLVLSFTRNGAAGIASALTKDHGTELRKSTESNFEGRNIRVRTFDSLIWSTFRNLGIKTHNQPNLHWQVKNLMEIGGKNLRQNGIELRVWTRFDFEKKLREICDLIARSQTLAPDPEALIMPLWRRLEARARKAGFALPSTQAELVAANAFKIAGIIAESYDLVMIDEAQDCSVRDLSPIVNLLKGPFETQVVEFGDPGQSVMEFRGSIGNVAAKLEDLGVCVDHKELTINRRSTSALVHAQNQLQIAGGWKGPLARSTKELSGGPSPLVVLVDNDSDLIDIHLAFLSRLGLAPKIESSLSESLIQKIDDRADFVLGNCGKRPPLVEILIPSREIGNNLKSSLQAYDIEFTWIQSASNPWDSRDAAVLHTWFDFNSDQGVSAGSLLDRHLNHWKIGLRADVKDELEACYLGLFSTASDLHGCRDRTYVSQELIKFCNNARNHSAVGEAGRRYLDSVERMLRAFERAGRTKSIDEALDGLESLFNGNLRNTRNRTDVPTFPAWITALIREEGVLPSYVADWLDKHYTDWRGRKPAEPDSGVIVKTPEMAKGDTVDAVLVHHAERVPKPKVHNPLLAESDSDSSSLAKAYVAVSRPKYAYIAASQGRFP
ncbi:MAG: UvrD-helicase domain-containing protein, partial [Candidatus Marsarchaeota archaeon]|nr:UvrD-helicase domain-containing protein [Candidatus Marsarchaeota archaeon]